MADQTEILKLIEQAAKEGWTKLDLSNNQLTSLPPEIIKLTNLTSLDLSNNQLTSLPPEITELSNLTSLDLGGNRLMSVPTKVTELTNLRHLDLGENQLTYVPLEITELTKLTRLILSGNQLTSVPLGISKLTKLTRLDLIGNQLTSVPPEITELPNLTNLELSGNQLTSLPPEITELTNLTTLVLSGNLLTSLPLEIGKLNKLTMLVLSRNQLTSLPPEISKLTKLSSLVLSENHLTSLPPEISKLTKLTSLVLSENHLTSLPPEISKLTKLTSLVLSENQLTSLPPEISKLTKLTRLVINGNPLASVPRELTKLTSLAHLHLGRNQLTSVPPEIIKLTNLAWLDLRKNPLPIPTETLKNPTDVKAIFAAIAGLNTGQRLNEAKMLVVGDGKVGKSSVVERLVKGTFDPTKATTLGVEINDEIEVSQWEIKSEGEPIKLNIWDFGGQEIQHSTHQFFLTHRSLYLLVMDARRGDQLSGIEYWLKLIESFGGDSPILVVINQIDQLKGQRPLNLDRRALQEKYNIKGFIETSCAEPPAGIEELKTAIAREVEQLRHVRDIWPREWFAVKQRLKAMKADYIPVEKYLEICGEEGVDDADIRNSLLEMLHALGTVIRFPGDTQVLNPRWVTQGVYGLLTSARLVKAQGQFDLPDVAEVLDGLPETRGHYPAHTHRRLIDVMKHFELCFEFTDRPGHYLIPRHLHDNELDIPWDDADALKFQYHYETLPDAVVSRFIVRMNQYIQQQYYWKNGVFLQSGENRAKIKADLVDRKIFITINGKEQTRRAFLAVIRSAFNEINSSFKIEIEQKIPVPGAPDVLVSYDDLLAHEEANEAEIFIPKLRKKLSVRELLDGVEELRTRQRHRERDMHQDKPFPRSTEVRILRIVVASPGDVQTERDALPAIIDEVNRTVAVDRGLRLELTRWETDTHPGFHPEGPQGLIDPILKITDCDLLLGIFWKRFGTPTTDGKTGTEHEFHLAYEAWKAKQSPQIFVYFNQKSYTPNSRTETDQWGQVLEFRNKFPKEGLWWPYEGEAAFEKLVRNHLINYLRNLSGES
ncbi:MAG: leucine-rich repeat domain-containing protein [Acidobacteria bacterium]|nr:leucine-rich repeat domain-containing protein [Acidobacteriota bacterium]